MKKYLRNKRHIKANSGVVATRISRGIRKLDRLVKFMRNLAASEWCLDLARALRDYNEQQERVILNGTGDAEPIGILKA